MRANETKILDFVGGYDKVFIIPPFQRNYDWKIEQCAELLDDINKVYDNNKTHYLGNIVYYVSKNSGAAYQEYVLIDGQQRITSILLLLCAIRDATDEESLKDTINKRYLKNDTSQNKFRVRLKQTLYDSDCFIRVVDQVEGANISSNIVNNYLFFKDRLQNIDISLFELYESINRLEIVDINMQISDDLEAIQTVFEKINSTGKKLNSADLIRNYLLLSNSYEEQEKLYIEYWIKIENFVKEHISSFANHYLRMKSCDEVSKDEVYKSFKAYFDEQTITHKEILVEMLIFSEYYSWLKYANSPNSQLNYIIKILNALKTDDMYPLYMYFMKEYYTQNITELLNIFELLSDFMLRYRIVAPARGGGQLRLVIYQLIAAFQENKIEKTYNSIYYELSNSKAPTGRFPDDQEFKSKLMHSVNPQYAKVLLVKIENYETKNIPVSIEHISLEHLLPQKPNKKWRELLGNEYELQKILGTYLHCIGNLTLVSQGYNSSMSNNTWDKKVEILSDVQFGVTRELTKYKEWQEDAIQNRSKDIAERACRAITAPLERTTAYQTQEAEALIEGFISLSDLETSTENYEIKSIMYNDIVYPCGKWRTLFSQVCSLLAKEDIFLFKSIVKENKIHKRTSKRNYPNKDPHISKEPSLLAVPVPIEGTIYFAEGNFSSLQTRKLSKEVADLFNFTEKFQIYVINTDND